MPLRFQGTLLTGIRGCDVAPKFIPPKSEVYVAENGRGMGAERELVAFLRFCVMNPADEREIDVPGAFFQSVPPAYWKPSQFGHYPQHWYAHLMHSFEVVGYCNPNTKLAGTARGIYIQLVHNLHLLPETFERMNERLTEDRIATNTVVS